MNKKELEQTLVLIKPDALKNSLTGYILSTLSEFHTGLHFSALKVVVVNTMLAEEHYAEHKGKAFFPSLLEYISGKLHYTEAWRQRVIAIIYQGPDAVKKMRDIVGPTNPLVARVERPGCIRSLGALVTIKDDKGNVIGDRMDNLIHASANLEDAEREIKLWFKPNDIPPLMHSYATTKNSEFYYYKNGKLLNEYEADCFCLLAPGDVAWKSDLETLQKLSKGIATSETLESVAAKYMLNE